jgi:hypothetical protein
MVLWFDGDGVVEMCLRWNGRWVANAMFVVVLLVVLLLVTSIDDDDSKKCEQPFWLQNLCTLLFWIRHGDDANNFSLLMSMLLNNV